jgi:hypothetical protein
LVFNQGGTGFYSLEVVECLLEGSIVQLEFVADAAKSVSKLFNHVALDCELMDDLSTKFVLVCVYAVWSEAV